MTSRCSVCLELKCPGDFYNYRNKYEKKQLILLVYYVIVVDITLELILKGI